MHLVYGQDEIAVGYDELPLVLAVLLPLGEGGHSLDRWPSTALDYIG